LCWCFKNLLCILRGRYMTQYELKSLSLRFRRTSSNLLNANDDNAAVMMQRFKYLIDETPFIADTLRKAMSGKEYDYHECFTNDRNSWAEINPPCDEGCHIKAQYDFLSEICEKGKVFGYAMRYRCKSNNINDITQHFINIAFKPLIDYINDEISKELILQEETIKAQAPMQQNIYGSVYGSANQASGDIHSSNETLVNNIREIAQLIEELLPAIKNADLDEDDKANAIDDLESINEEISKAAPKKVRLKKASSGICNFLSKSASVVSASVILAEKLPLLIDHINAFIATL